MADTWKIRYRDTLWLDITPLVPADIDDVDSVWPGTWSGSWTVKTDLAATESIKSGLLILFDGIDGRPNTKGKFRLEITSGPADPNPLPISDDYLLSIEIYNGSTTFRKELPMSKLKVSQDGV